MPEETTEKKTRRRAEGLTSTGKRGHISNAESKGLKNAKERRDDDGNRKQFYAHFKEGRDYSAIEPDDLTPILEQFIEQGEQKKKGQQPTYENKYQLQDAIQLYWHYLQDSYANGAKIIPDVEGACCYLGISRTLINKWERENYRDFAETIIDLKNKIATAKKQLGLKGRIPPLVLAMDMNNNHGYVQKQEVVVNADYESDDNIPLEDLRKKYGGQMLSQDVIEGEYREVKQAQLPKPAK